MNDALTEADHRALRGLGQGQVPGAVEAILASHLDRWEWEYGERCRRLESERDDLRCRLAATEIQLRGARLALAACRDVHEARQAER